MSKPLGDFVATVISNFTNLPECLGCKKRKEWLNEHFPDISLLDWSEKLEKSFRDKFFPGWGDGRYEKEAKEALKAKGINVPPILADKIKK